MLDEIFSRHWKVCYTCSGLGMRPDTGKKCDVCGGTGAIYNDDLLDYIFTSDHSVLAEGNPSSTETRIKEN